MIKSVDLFGGEKQNKRRNGEQSDLCDLEQVTLEPQLQVHHCDHCLTTWLQLTCCGVKLPERPLTWKIRMLVRRPTRGHEEFISKVLIHTCSEHWLGKDPGNAHSNTTARGFFVFILNYTYGVFGYNT